MLTSLIRFISAACFLLSCATAQSSAGVDFRRDVQPIFREHCYDCHGPAQQMNRFRLDRRSDAMKGGTISVIGPGNALGSRLYLRLIGDRFGQQMPPSGPLPDEQIAIIKAWIDDGARWPDEAAGETRPIEADPTAGRLIELLRAGDRSAFRKAVLARPAAAKAKGPGGVTPLMAATLYGDVADLELVLRNGGDPNARNDAGATALMWAADNFEKANLLLGHAADVNARSADGRTALIIAAGCLGNSGVVRLLLANGAEVNAATVALRGTLTALTEAARAGDEVSVKLLLEHGADIKLAGPGVLAAAIRSNCQACVDAVRARFPAGLSKSAIFLLSPPLGPATSIQAMLDDGVPTIAHDAAGNSILALAAASEMTPVAAIQALLKAGADVNARADRSTALELAMRHGQTAVVDLLRKAGAAEPMPPAQPEIEFQRAATPRATVKRSLPLLQQSDEVFLAKTGCVSCHHNSLTSFTLAAARTAGFQVDEGQVARQSKTIGTYLEGWRERVLQNSAIPGEADTAGYLLLGLAAAKYVPDAATDAMAIYLKRTQLPDGHWPCLTSRPPLESSQIEVTAAAMRGIQVYAPRPRRADYDAAVRRAAAWIAQAPVSTNEDRVFQILGLVWAGGHLDAISKAADALSSLQHSDGGWSQLPTLGSDAYATGQALTALLHSGRIDRTGPIAKRAMEFLMNSQAADGSWYVAHRALPIQPYFESGFPYGRDQFISISATNWAAAGLALMMTPPPSPPGRSAVSPSQPRLGREMQPQPHGH